MYSEPMAARRRFAVVPLLAVLALPACGSDRHRIQISEDDVRGAIQKSLAENYRVPAFLAWVEGSHLGCGTNDGRSTCTPDERAKLNFLAADGLLDSSKQYSPFTAYQPTAEGKPYFRVIAKSSSSDGSSKDAYGFDVARAVLVEIEYITLPAADGAGMISATVSFRARIQPFAEAKHYLARFGQPGGIGRAYLGEARFALSNKGWVPRGINLLTWEGTRFPPSRN